MTGPLCLPMPRRSMLGLLASAGLAGGLPHLAGCAASATDDLPTSEAQADAQALDAYVYNYPLAYFARIRALRLLQPDPVTQVRSRWSSWMHRNVPVTPAIAGAPQTDTLYSSLWLDVADEPVVVFIPPIGSRYWSIQFSDLMGTTYGLLTRRNFARGGPALVVGPAWDGAAPAGMTVLRPAMAQSFNLLRLFFADRQDLPAAIALQDAFQAVPLSAWLRGERRFPGIDGSAVYRPVAPQQDPLADFRAMHRIWQESPPGDVPAALRRRFERLGIIGPANSLDTLAPEQRRVLERAEAEGRRRVTQASLALPGRRTATGWVAPLPRIGFYDDGDRLYRASVTLAGTVALPASENPYYVMQKDPSGELLHGDRRYRIRFDHAQLPQVDAFWSLHAYNQQYRVIPNPLARYSIGDRTPGLERGADGSLTLVVQADDPGPAQRSNWLPVKAGEAFWLIIRAYEPRGDLRDLRWDGPTVTRVG